MRSASIMVSRIKLLCSLGINGQILAPALLRELHDVVPSLANTFLWLNKQYSITNVYDESPDAAFYVMHYFREFHDRDESRIKCVFSELLRARKVVTTTERVVPKDFYCSRLYNEILRPMSYHHSALVVIREKNNHIGVMALNRCEKDSKFTAAEIRLLVELMPSMALGLSCCSYKDVTALDDSEESGLIVLDLQGEIEYISPQGNRLLFLATHPVISAATVCDQQTDVHDVDAVIVPPEVRQLCCQLAGSVLSENDFASSPVWKHTNPWGGFEFRAYWLKENDCQEQSLIGITIRRQIPLSLKLLHRFEALSLTPKQIQIAMLLTAGQTYHEIANSLHISSHTVIDHVRKLQERFQVHNRSELVATLLMMR